MNKKYKGIGSLVTHSVILHFFAVCAGYIYNAIIKSFTASLFCSFDKAKAKYQSSIFCKLFSKIKTSSEKRMLIKNKILYFSETSVASRIYHKVTDALLGTKLRIYGVAFFIYGLLTIGIGVIREFVAVMGNSTMLILEGAFLMAFSIPLLVSKKELGFALCESVFGKFFICGIIGIDMESIEKIPAKESMLVPIVSGLFLGIVSIRFDPVYVIVFIIALIVSLLIIHKPEFGVFIITVALPFLPTMAVCGIIIFVTLAFFYKVIRGKRSVKFDILDIFCLVFMLFLLLGGVFSVSPKDSIKPALVFICFMMGYFLIVNLIKTVELLNKIVYGSVFSLFICSAYGIYQNYFGIRDTTWTDTDMFSDIETRVVSTFENPNVFGEYLIMMIPLALGLFFVLNGYRKKLVSAFVCISTLAALIFTWSRGAWLGMIFSLIIYILMLNKNAIIVYLLGIFVFPFTIPFLPQSIVARFSSIGNLSDTSTSYRVHIWEAAVKIIKDFFVGGIGIGTGAFSVVYPKYSLSGIESAPHSHNLYFQIIIEMGIFALAVFAIIIYLLISKTFTVMAIDGDKNIKRISSACMCGVLAFLIQGMTDYVWYNYRVFAIFWLMIGIASASANLVMKEKDDKDVFDNLY